MANPKIKYDVDEVDEILNLFKKKQRQKGIIFTGFKPKSVSNFNAEIIANKIKRSNGKPFTLYKYHFWAGSQPNGGDFNYGKKRIMQMNDEIIVDLVGNDNDADMQDIITMIENNHKNPNKLTALICNQLKKQKNKAKVLLDENLKLEEENKKLKSHNTLIQDSFTNIVFNSQNSENSLNNMLSFKKSGDAFICEELENMFEDGLSRFNILANLNNENNASKEIQDKEHNKLQNLINFKEKERQQQKLKQLEDEGF